RAIRVFEEQTELSLKMKIMTRQNDHGLLEIDINDQFGNRPVQIKFDRDGQIKSNNGHVIQNIKEYEPGRWYDLAIEINAEDMGRYSLRINDDLVLKDAVFAGKVKSLERISFRTGPYRDLPNRKTDNEAPHAPLPGADKPVNEASYFIDDLWVSRQR
ncbi:MAG: hypothetical protein KDC53_17150, partial [Saprospiraceae bacterium]|nr:hypothetical protein [Saprospiraceae bacterium]